jgi:hypothetical protein
MTYTVGPCAANEACRNYDPHTGQAGDAEAHALCDTCLRVAAFAVQALPRDWLDLEQLLPKPLGQWGDGQPRGHNGPPAPINLAAEALQQAIWWTATAWEGVARDLHHLSPTPYRRPGPGPRICRLVATVDGQIDVVWSDGRIEHPSARPRTMRPGPADVVRAANILHPRLGPLSDVDPVPLLDYPLADPDQATVLAGHTHIEVPGWQGVLDLATLHRRAVAMLGLTQPTRRLPGACPERGCGVEDLRQDQPRFRGDEPFVYCGACATQWPYDDYRRNTSPWEVAA